MSDKVFSIEECGSKTARPMKNSNQYEQ